KNTHTNTHTNTHNYTLQTHTQIILHYKHSSLKQANTYTNTILHIQNTLTHAHTLTHTHIHKHTQAHTTTAQHYTHTLPHIPNTPHIYTHKGQPVRRGNTKIGRA